VNKVTFLSVVGITFLGISSYLAASPSIATAAAAATSPIGPRRPASEMITEVVREYGPLTIRSQVGGAAVWVGDRKVGETQVGATLRVRNVEAGTHRLIARKPGHHEWSRQIDVIANQQADVMIDLQPDNPQGGSTGQDGEDVPERLRRLYDYLQPYR
jgi:PEGA domain